MSLRQAIELVKADLPLASRSIIFAKITDETEECTGDGFSFWRNKRPNDLRSIVERRLKMTEESQLRIWLEGQLELLDQVGETENLYQGYAMIGEYRQEFAVAPSLGKSVKYLAKA